MSDVDNPPRRKRGRPRKSDVSSVKKGSRNAVGRPKGDAAVINEYKARMLASPKSRKVLDTIFDAALDHDHKNQAAAWKLVMDIILPVAAFEKDIVKDGGRNAIQINISGVGAVATSGDIVNVEQPTVIEGEVVNTDES